MPGELCHRRDPAKEHHDGGQVQTEAGKATFVSLLGLADAKSRAETLVSEACDVLAPYGSAADPLRQVARFVIQRNM